MSITVQAGQTYRLYGTFASGGELYALAGSGTAPHGALITVPNSATYGGIILLEANQAAGMAQSAGRTGATLSVTGTLVNTGAIVAEGGYPVQSAADAIAGATISIAGVLINNREVVVGSAVAGSYYYNHGFAGTGGVLIDSHYIQNNYDIVIEGSSPEYQPLSSPAVLSAPSGTFTISGTLANTNFLYAGGGTGHGPTGVGQYRQALGAQLRVTSTGTLTNTGHVYVAGGYGGSAPFYAPAGATLQNAGVLTNSGTINVGAGQNYYYLHQYGPNVGLGALLSVTTTGKLTNSGQIILTAAAYLGYDAQTSATLADQGMLTNTNTGTITVGAVPAKYDGYAGQATGALLSVGGTLTNAGAINVQGGSGQGLDQSQGGTLSVLGSLSNTGRLTLDGGTYGYKSAGFGAVFMDSGIVTNTGTILATGATGGYSSYLGTAASISVAGTLTNQKLIELQGGQTPAPAGKNGAFTAGAQLTDSKLVNNYGTIKLDGGIALHDHAATLTVTGTLTNSGNINGAGTLVNLGTILSGAALTGNIASTGFLNDGLVKVSPNSALTVASAVTATINDHGTFDITSGGTLSFNAAVGISQSVSFVSTGPEKLVLGSVSAFSGVLAGLHPINTIDFLHANVSSAVASGTTLTLDLSSGGVLHLKLAAALPVSDVLKLSSDGNGGTNLLITTPPPAAQPTTPAASAGAASNEPLHLAPTALNFHLV